jgi:hypothetical protein
VKQYEPSSWGLVEWDKRPGQPYYKGRTRRDLLRLWTIICDSVLEIYMEKNNIDSVRWVPGFLFSDDREAGESNENGTYLLLINPVTKEGLMKYSIRSQESWAFLIAFAVHEILHLNKEYHDEDYAGEITNLFAKVFAARKVILRRMKEVLAKD